MDGWMVVKEPLEEASLGKGQRAKAKAKAKGKRRRQQSSQKL